MDGFMHLRRGGVLKRHRLRRSGAAARARCRRARSIRRALCAAAIISRARSFSARRNSTRGCASLRARTTHGLVMSRVSDVNQLYGGREALDATQRRDARFFNTCMMATLLGAAVSDALDDGRVVSGVGGQYNFVAMAHAIAGGRSVLLLRATRTRGTQNRIEHPLELRPYDDPAASARHLRHRVRHGGPARQERRGVHPRDACDQRRALPGRARRAGDARRQARARFPHSGRVAPQHAADLAERMQPFVARGLFPTFPFGSDFNGDRTARCCPRCYGSRRSTADWRRWPAVLGALLSPGQAGSDRRRARSTRAAPIRPDSPSA